MHIYLIFALAFILRLINLNQSLWLDESIVAKVVRTIPFHQIISQLSPTDVHPPLYYMFMSLWSGIFGSSEIALRFPSVIFSLITGLFIYKIGLLWKDKKVALWATVFFLFNPLIVYYSQEARMHMMAAMLLSVTLYYFTALVKKKENPSSKNIVLFNLFSAIAMLTFYGSAFFIITLILIGFFILPKGKKWMPLVGLSLSLVALSPLLYRQIMNARAGLGDLKNWSMALGKAELKNVLMIFLKFATGRLSWYPKWSYYLPAGIVTVVTWFFVALGMRKNKMVAVIFCLPLILGLMISFIAPMMMYFRFLYLIPVMSLLLAAGVIYRFRTQYIITIFFIIFSLIYLLIPAFHREDWKSLAEELNPSTRVYMIIPSSDPIAYYRNDIPVFELRDLKKTTVPEFITIIPYTSDLYGFNYSDVLLKKGCIKKSNMQFRGDLQLEQWICLSKG